MRRTFIRLGLAILALCLIGSLVFADALTDRVDKLFAQWDKPDSPGCALGIIKDGRLIYKRGYGMANLEYSIPITSESVFRIGSTSKQFTAMCIALLEEERALSLDDDIRKYIPEIPEYESSITIRHLLHHTSGIRDYLTLSSLAGARDDDFFVDEEVVELLARQRELNFKPGEEHLYSNSGYFLLSVIVKRVTGRSLRFYAEKNIFEPLGMKHSHFHDDHTMVVKNRASGYSPQNGGGFRISMTTLDMIGDGGIFTCVDDLLLWDKNFYHNKLGKGCRELIDRMLTTGSLNNGERLDYALGLVIGDYRGLSMVSHGGAFVGFRAEMIRFPEQSFSVIVLANLATINPSKLTRQLVDIYLADAFKEKPKVPTEKPNFVKLSKTQLEEKAGAYYNKKREQIWKISLKEGILIVDASVYDFRIMPTSATHFLAIQSPQDWEIEFEKFEDDKPKLMRVTGEEGSLTFEPIQLEKPTLAELAEFLGEYFSPELQVTYKIELKDRKLFLRHENPHKDYPEKLFEATFKDRFQVSSIGLIFFRNKRDEIVSFTMNAGRVRNIRFYKK
ncbi:MAG: beta-lactamase family protein [Candidatus Aminicenantes bacterium]|nr:beta-lactamase family protein [Candidatus Aminicenantes bacterium]MDH5383435.1 beta-lactamase family protein [Candidatus Aminicenantes bacterium]MDH5743579.1 beta-lactamase family protein [Candidatus Aminicenantes bacterium]